jgi:hypothetical protein
LRLPIIRPIALVNLFDEELLDQAARNEILPLTAGFPEGPE